MFMLNIFMTSIVQSFSLGYLYDIHKKMCNSVNIFVRRFKNMSSSVFVYCEAVRMSSWKLQMAAVVIVRTELTICKLYTNLLRDFSNELVYWNDALTYFNSVR